MHIKFLVVLALVYFSNGSQSSSGYYFEAWLMLEDTPFTLDYMNTSTDEYKEAALRATDEIHSYFNTVEGYLFNRVLKLSPQPSFKIGTFATAEVAMYCIESSVHLLKAKLNALIQKSNLFDSSYLKVKYPLDCRTPIVDLQLKRSISEADILYTTNRSFILRTTVANNCSTSNLTQFQWRFCRVDPETNYFLTFMMSGVTDKSQMKLEDRRAGDLYVYLEVSVSGLPEAFACDYGFVRIRHPDLVAKIVAPGIVSKQGTAIKLDGSRSYDPELPNRTLEFSWRCRRQCKGNPSDNFPVDGASVEPCYGIANSTDYVLSNQRAFTIDVVFLKSSCTYVFRLTVAKDRRITHADHALEVTPGVSFSIRCINNCQKKISPQRLLTLQVFCGSLPCTSLRTFSWTFHSHSINGEGKSVWTELKNITGLVSTSLNTTQFDVPRVDALISVEDMQKFQIKAQATDYNGRKQEQKFYTIVVNAPPKRKQGEQSGCEVWPRKGSAIITGFRISCLGWYDTDTPLRYAFKYTFSSSTIIIQDGNVGDVTSKLPLGDPAKDYERTLFLQIIDAFGEFTTVSLETKVTPPPASESLLNLIKEAQNKMKLLVQGNNVDKAADMAITILSVIDNNDQLKRDETFKDSVLDIMSGVEVNRLNLVTKVAVITAYSTKRTDHALPQSAQENALTLLRKSTTFLATMKKGTGEELEVSDQINVNTLAGIGNVMMASSKQARIGVDANIDENKSKTIAKECVELVRVMKDEVVTPEGICENPIVISTPYINLTACIEKANDMKVQKLLKGENGVKLPDTTALFPGMEIDDNTVIDVKLVSFKVNPYTWHPKSRIIRSSVLDVTLKNVTSGKPLHVEGLKKPVELFIKNWEGEKEQEQRQKQQKKPQKEYFIKPSPPNSTRNMRFHQINLSFIDLESSIKIVPSNNEKLEIYVRKKFRPTPADNDFQTVVPNLSACLNYTQKNGFFNCPSDPYLFTLSPKITGDTGTHFLGIRYLPKTPDNSNSTRTKRSCRGVSGGRHKRSCVEVKDPPVVGKLATSEFRNGTDVKYELKVTMGACMYWSEEDSEWTNKGCKIGSESKVSKIHCLCNHLSAFGGDFFVAPNEIDFDKVFAEFGRLGETGNYVVLSFVCVVFGLYAISLVLARRADRKDDYKVAPNVHLMTGGNGVHTHTYNISIQTGIWRGCGTTANVTIVLFGDSGCSPPILLTQSHLNKRFFARGSVNTFTIHLTEFLGTLYKIQIWHDNSGESPTWFFHQVLVTCNATGEKWYFLGNRWLALEKGDGEIKADISSAGNKESLAFRNLFHLRGSKTLGEKHLWLSLFTKAPHNTFTRCQRLSCCLSILFAAMVTNAMFYKQGIQPEDSFKIGPIQLSWTQIKIGLQSGLVSIPVNVLVVAIFRNIKPSPSKENSNNYEAEDEDTNPAGCFPHFCVYIGWALCIVASLVAAAFVVFYSLMWGKKVANQWLASVLISFFQDVIVIQPIKVVILVSLLSLIVKKPVENDEVYGQGHLSHTIDNELAPYHPRGKELHKVRSVRVLKSRLVTVLIEFALFSLFLFLLMVVCYGNRDTNRYQLTESIRNAFKGFEKVNGIETFWKWTRENLVPGLYNVTWYNGRPFSYAEGFITNREYFMVGLPRFRQKRLQRESACQVSQSQPQFNKQFPRCIPYYSEKTEDRTNYHMPKWIPVRNESAFRLLFERFYLCPRPWRYETANELQTLSFQGMRSAYSGGGFIADLGYNSKDAQQVIDSLEINDWIDNMTAAVFIEFTVYEPTSSLFNAVKLLFERFPSGGTNTITQFKTLTVYSPQDAHFRGFYETCQFLLMLVLLLCVGTEVRKVFQHGCVYLKNPWSWLEIILIASALVSLAMFFLKQSYTSDFIRDVRKNPFQSWSSDNIALWSDLEEALLSFVVFLVTIKLLRIIRFNPHIIQMRVTLGYAAKYFWSFSVAFMTIIISYVMLTTLAFGRNVYEYRSFFQSFSSVLLMFVGSKAPFYDLQMVNIILGQFFIFAYMVSIVMVLLNMFLAILNEAFTESREQGQEGLPDLELVNLLKKTAKKTAKQMKVTAIKVIEELRRLVRQRQPRSALAVVESECLLDNSFGENERDSAFNDDDNISLTDIIALLSGIKHDLSNSVMFLDDIVPMVKIHDADKRWCRSNYSTDDDDGTI